jgi:hypothetical protein
MPKPSSSTHEWQQLSGWISWSLNVFPLLHPALCHIYKKTSEKANTLATIYLNLAVKADLSWFLNHIRASPGIFAFHAIDWNPHTETDFLFYATHVHSEWVFGQNKYGSDLLRGTI